EDGDLRLRVEDPVAESSRLDGGDHLRRALHLAEADAAPVETEVLETALQVPLGRRRSLTQDQGFPGGPVRPLANPRGGSRTEGRVRAFPSEDGREERGERGVADLGRGLVGNPQGDSLAGSDLDLARDPDRP